MPISSAKPPMQVLILMRHATRAGGLDTLAAEGHKQAESFPELLRAKLAKLARFAKQENLAALAPDSLAQGQAVTWQIFASPKIRTQQTLRFLTELLRTNFETARSEIFEKLDERTSSETQTEFENRVRAVLDTWHDEMRENKTSAEIRVACSHLDWLEAAAIYLSSDESDSERAAPWPPLETRIYFLQNGIWNRFRHSKT